MPPFTRPSMFGLSPTSIRSSIGWNNAGSSIEFNLVQDVSNGDSPAFPTIGGASYFTLGSYSFNGLLTKYTQNRSKDGYPVWEARIQDPRHLLDQCKIITSDFRLTTTGFFNLFNVFGYWENTGYGNSQLNDTGMPWELVRDGILNICNAAYGDFGGPITYKGQTFSLDLSQLPALPSYFRVGGRGQGLSITDFIQTCCEAANYDFYVKLSAFQIQLKTVPRVNAYPLGTIGTMLSTTFAGQVLRSSDGLEERDEPTSVFLIGGDVHELVKVDPNDVYQFCGFDASGVIMAFGGGGPYTSFANFAVHDPSVPILGMPAPSINVFSYPVRQYTIYTPELSSITGQSYWFTDDLELEIVLGLGKHKDTFTSWCHFLNRSNPSLYQIIALSREAPNIQPPVGFLDGVINWFATPNNVVNTAPNRISDIQLAGRGTLFTTGQWRLRLVYEVLAKFAQETYGKKYAVKLPNVLRKVDTDTGVISNSHDICDGGWVDDTDPNDLLSLPSYASDLFQTQDGRFVGFVKFDSINADLSRVNPSNSLVNGTDLYIKSKINNQIYFDGSNNAFAVIEVDPVYDYPDMVVGLSGVIGPLYVATGINYGTSPIAYNSVASQRALRDLISNQAQTSIPLVVHPRPRFPTGYEIPIKSNILTYGPWYAQGDTGRVTYEQDSSLVPWNYGSYANLDLAGAAKSAQGVSAIQVIETGYVEVAGYPAYNIGDVIQANGPNITNISIDFGGQGVTTTYRFETYVPRYGQLGKYNVDRFKKLNIATHKIMNEAKSRNRLISLAGVAEGEAQRTLNMLPEMFAAINIRSPNNAIVAKSIQTPSGERYPLVSTTTYPESLGMIPPDPSGYNSTTIGTWEQFIHPYSIYHDATYMPRQDFPTGVFDDDSIACSLTLQPWKDTDNGYTVRQYTKGDNVYVDMNDYFATGINPGSSSVPKRVFGLRGPVVINGWGYDIECNLAPTGINYLTDASSWKTGPLDPLWDDNRKTWSVHDLLNGVVQETIPLLGSGLVSVYKKGSITPQNIYGFNWISPSISSGLKVSLGYVATDNRWYINNNAGGDTFCIAINDECADTIKYLHNDNGYLTLNNIPCEECISGCLPCLRNPDLCLNTVDEGTDNCTCLRLDNVPIRATGNTGDNEIWWSGSFCDGCGDRTVLVDIRVSLPCGMNVTLTFPSNEYPPGIFNLNQYVDLAVSNFTCDPMSFDCTFEEFSNPFFPNSNTQRICYPDWDGLPGKPDLTFRFTEGTCSGAESCEGSGSGGGGGGTGGDCFHGLCGDAGISSTLTATVTDKAGIYLDMPDTIEYECQNSGGGFHQWIQTTPTFFIDGNSLGSFVLNSGGGIPGWYYSGISIQPADDGYTCSPFSAVFHVGFGGNTCTITITG